MEKNKWNNIVQKMRMIYYVKRLFVVIARVTETDTLLLIIILNSFKKKKKISNSKLK